MRIESQHFLLKLIYICSISFIYWGCRTEPQIVEDTSTLESHPLYHYVYNDDPVSSYSLVSTTPGEGYVEYILRLVSQNWLTEEEVDETEWWHWVTIVVPDEVKHETGMMWIGGGSRDNVDPLHADDRFVKAAVSTQSIITHIHNIPFQPLSFKDDTIKNKYEDAIIAYGWRKFLEKGGRDEDAYYLARFPMTRAVVLAMDATTEFVAKNKKLKVDKFVVAGASKRGWTTWTTAAFDKRVVAAIPLVIDLLNLGPSFMHHWRSYGEWSPAVKEYVDEGIMDWMGSKEYKRLLELTEPYTFKKRYTMPKLIVNATQDEFFLPDSWQFYRDSLPGETHFSYVPNVGHSLGGSYALETVMAFYRMILEGTARPKLHWSADEEGFIIESDPANPPVSVKLWEALNPDTRDFRSYVLGPAWTSTELPISENGIYEIKLDQPEEGWKASMVEFTFAGKESLKLTTGVKVLPQAYLYEAFSPEQPKGNLISE